MPWKKGNNFLALVYVAVGWVQCLSNYTAGTVKKCLSFPEVPIENRPVMMPEMCFSKPANTRTGNTSNVANAN